MACMFNKYFALALHNNTGESLAVPNIVKYKNIYIIISWKLTKILHVYNKNHRNSVSIYRPVLLLDILSEVMTKYIHNHVSIITNNMICSEQHGFIKGESCSTQLADVYLETDSYLDS